MRFSVHFTAFLAQISISKKHKRVNVPFKLSTMSLSNFFFNKKVQRASTSKDDSAIATRNACQFVKGVVTFCSGPVLHHQKGVVGNMAWRCLLCSRFAAFLLASLLTHYNSEHSDKDQKFKIRCGLDDCDKEYSKVNLFTKHVRSSHHRYLLCSSSNHTGGEPSLTSG